MNSEERREARYRRRKAARQMRIDARNKTMEEVFSYTDTYKGYLASRKGVGWKASTQTYKANAAANVRKAQKEVLAGAWKSKGFIEFDLIDRGKKRHIRSVHISERVIQHTVCDQLLTPLLTPTLIYDNSGSIAGRGMDFALNRCARHIREQVRKYGRELYALTYDFSGFFDNADHEATLAPVHRYVKDIRLVSLITQFVQAFGEKGLGLGSQVSQNLVTVYPNRIDHVFKEDLQIRAYGRYMDDGYAIHHSKGHLQRCFMRLREECAKLGIKLNPKKTGIRKLSRGLTFLKVRFTITETGKVLRRVCRKSITRARRKLKKLILLCNKGLIGPEDVHASLVSMVGHLKRGANYRARMNLQNLYQKLAEVRQCT